MGAAWHGPAAGEIQRTRILQAVVDVVCERGMAGASVGLVIARAKVSRHAFYERFEGLGECLIAILDGALERAAPLVVEAFDHSTPTRPWQEGMRGALGAMLDFFDEQPALARVCLVELGAAGPTVRAHRERILAAFAGMILEQIESEVSHPSPLAAEGAYASVVGIVNARLVGDERGPLVELLGPLMGIIVGPFMDEAEVSREIELGNELARELRERRALRALHVGNRNVHVPDELLSARAHHSRLCLLYVAKQNRLGVAPSNRQVGEGLGLTHRGQVSRLLGKLAGLGLIDKRSEGAGYPNAWSLTPEGKRVAGMLAEEW